jgi:NAD(P)-dependent dehydrogenase (short-subunit alcohol dehydrogenase family)
MSEIEGLSEHQYVRYTDLARARVFITGGGSGIGAHLVSALAQQGASVAFIDLHDEPAGSLCAAIGDRDGRTPHFERCDVTDHEALRACLTRVQQRLGPVTVLINNVASDARHVVEHLSVEQWDHSIATNLRPYFLTAQAVVPGMAAAGGGSIINMGSNSANLGLAGYPAYVTAKAAIVGLTRALARELGGRRVRVNTLIPGWVMTARQRSVWVTPQALEQTLAEQCLKEPIQGEDIADAALFLASASARMITGQSLIVDGGRALI